MKKLITSTAFLILFVSGFSQTWTSLNCPTPGGQLGDIDRTNSNIYATRLTGGFFKSTDAGATWNDVTANYPTGQTQIFKCLNSGNILLHIFTGTTFPWYKSTDQGATWTQITGSTPTNSSLYESPNGTLYAVPSFDGFSAIKTSTDEGTTWTSQSGVMKSMAFTTNGDAYGLRWDSGSGEVKLAKSTDNGQTWTDLTGTGLPITSTQIVISPNGNMYVPGSPTFKSTDNGSTFTSVVVNSDELFVDNNNNLFMKKAPSTFSVSVDDGATWTDATGGLAYPSGTVRSIWGHPNGNTYASNYNPSTSSWGIYEYGSVTSYAKETTSSMEIKISPNPSNGKFIIDTKTIANGEFTVYDALGKKVFEKTFRQQASNEIDLTNFGEGIYFLKIKEGDQVYTNKIVVE